MPNYERFDRTYFEEGVAKGVSCYTNYTWQPEYSIPFAHRLIRMLNIVQDDVVLDYGCSKGYLVKALRLLGIETYGCDVSGYALGMSPPDVRQYLTCSDGPEIPYQKPPFGWVVAKDTLEHLSEAELHAFLASAWDKTKNLFVVVPLGDGEKYNIPAYELDVTHIIRQPVDWWAKVFIASKFVITKATSDMRGIKDSWAHFPRGNAAFWLKKA